MAIKAENMLIKQSTADTYTGTLDLYQRGHSSWIRFFPVNYMHIFVLFIIYGILYYLQLYYIYIINILFVYLYRKKDSIPFLLYNK